MKPGLKVVDGMMSVKIGQIPSIHRSELETTDLRVASVDGGTTGDGFGIWWHEVIYRPRNGELFKIRCRDGENGGYQPDNESGCIPNCQLEVQ